MFGRSCNKMRENTEANLGWHHVDALKSHAAIKETKADQNDCIETAPMSWL